MSEAAEALKVDLQPSRMYRTYRGGGHRPTPLRRALPFYLSRWGKMTHRVRSGYFHLHEGNLTATTGHVSFALWCGQGGALGKGELTAEPHDRFPICGTCEGRAVGAGYESAAFLIQKRALLFTPRERQP